MQMDDVSLFIEKLGAIALYLLIPYLVIDIIKEIRRRYVRKKDYRFLTDFDASAKDGEKSPSPQALVIEKHSEAFLEERQRASFFGKKQIEPQAIQKVDGFGEFFKKAFCLMGNVLYYLFLVAYPFLCLLLIILPFLAFEVVILRQKLGLDVIVPLMFVGMILSSLLGFYLIKNGDKKIFGLFPFPQGKKKLNAKMYLAIACVLFAYFLLVLEGEVFPFLLFFIWLFLLLWENAAYRRLEKISQRPPK